MEDLDSEREFGGERRILFDCERETARRLLAAGGGESREVEDREMPRRLLDARVGVKEEEEAVAEAVAVVEAEEERRGEGEGDRIEDSFLLSLCEEERGAPSIFIGL